MTLYVTTSEIKAWQRCRREWQYSYDMQIVPKREGGALRMGTAVHAGLEVVLAGGPVESVLAAVEESARANALYTHDWAKAAAMAEAYARHYAGDDFKVLAIEQTFKVQRPGYVLAGKFDALIEDSDGVKVMEHKTSGEDISPGSAYWQHLALDLQVSNYLYAAEKLDLEPVSMLYDVIGKPRSRVSKNGESGESYRRRCLLELSKPEKREGFFRRDEVVRLGRQLEEHEQEIDRIVEDMQESKAKGGWQPKTTGACKTRFGRLCPYLGVCSHTARLEDQSLFVKKNNKHTELSL